MLSLVARVLLLSLASDLVLTWVTVRLADAQIPSNGSYLHSRLMPTKPEGTCPPDIDPMYSAYAIVTGTDMRQRPWGFAQTLREVLVKSSGDPRLQDDPRTAALGEHADQYVACFSYRDMMEDTPLHDEQGTYDRPHKLTVVFDPGKIDALLAEFGDKPWRGERPIIVPVLLVRGPRPPPYLLSADEPRGKEQREAFAIWADTAGVTARFPGAAELATWGVSPEHFPSLEPAPSRDKNAKEVLVTGTLDWNETLPGWVARWHLRWHGADHSWGVSGVNYDAAFRDLVRGAMLLASGNGSPD